MALGGRWGKGTVWPQGLAANPSPSPPSAPFPAQPFMGYGANLRSRSPGGGACPRPSLGGPWGVEARYAAASAAAWWLSCLSYPSHLSYLSHLSYIIPIIFIIFITLIIFYTFIIFHHVYHIYHIHHILSHLSHLSYLSYL